MYFKISLNNFADVNKFVSIAQNISEDTILHGGRFAVDAKSIIGIFSLALSKPLMLEIDARDGSPDEATFAELFKNFLITKGD